MAIYRGLNVAKALNDVDDPEAALTNLGLNEDDLELISGLTSAGTDVSIKEFHTLAGLVDDQKKSLYSLNRSSEVMSAELNALDDIKLPLKYNYRLNGRLEAGAIKYKYFDFATGAEKQADISTSRVSSWSTIGGAISYGGEILVKGTQFTFDSLGTTVAPIARAFRSEVPTHTLRLQVDGVEQDFLAMKGIPLVFDTFFRNTELYAAVNSVSDSLGPVPYTWRITNDDDGSSFNSGDGTGGSGSLPVGTESSPSSYNFLDSRERARKLEFFYNPANILNLKMTGLKLSTWTSVSLPALKRLDISSNDFYQLPSFRSGLSVSAKTTLTLDGLAPVLTHLVITNNNMSRATSATGAQITANAQLNTLPTTLISLEINGVFSDSTTIDLLDYTNLTHFSMNSYYSENAQRSMTGGTIMPQVANSIVQYRIYNQPYPKVCDGITSSLVLNYFYFPYTGAATKEDGSAITIASPDIEGIYSISNSHNVINMSGKSKLTSYIQQYSTPPTTDPTDASFVGKFTNCVKLSELNFYSSSVTGSIEIGLQGLPDLTYFEGRSTRISGELRDGSFLGTGKLNALLLAGSSHTGTNFFGNALAGGVQTQFSGQVFKNTPNLGTLYTYSNKNIRGKMPDMSVLKNIRVVYLHNTGLSGPLPNYNGAEYLYYLRMDYTKDGSDGGFTGAIPAFALPGLNYLFLTFNNLTGQCPKFECPNLYQLYLDSNQLSGSVPDLSSCQNLQLIVMNNNLMTSYRAGSLSKNIYASTIDISNNKLPAGVGPTLIDDLLKNWTANPRGGVTVNLLGNTGLSENSSRNDGTTGASSTAGKLDTIRQKGWTILMD